MRVTMYGHFTGWSSYPAACKRLARHLLEKGVDLGLVNHRDGPCESFEHIRGGDRTDPIGFYHGFADGLIRVPRHERMIGYHVGDVDVIPKTWVEPMNRLDLVITQSSWCMQVFRRSGVKVPIFLSRAGVDEAFVPGASHLPGEFLRIAHFNSSEQWFRKGTAEVIVAMQKLNGALPIKVEVHTDHPSVKDAVLRARAPGLVLAARHDPMPPKVMAAVVRGYDALLAPSRCEGLGLQPAEFLSCGLPVVATTCTGFSETLDSKTPGLVPIPTGALTACGAFGRAPSLDADSVAAGLKALVARYPSLLIAARDNAANVMKKWGWNNILEADRFASLVLSR